MQRPVAEVLLVSVLRAKDEFAHAGMKPVRADGEIEVAFTAMLEFNMHFAVCLAQIGNAVSEDDLARPADPVVEKLRKVAASERDVSPAGELAEHLHAKS